MPFILSSGRLNISKDMSLNSHIANCFRLSDPCSSFIYLFPFLLFPFSPIIAHSLFPSAPNNSPYKSTVMMIGHQTRTTEDSLLVLPSFFVRTWSHGGQESRLWLLGYVTNWFFNLNVFVQLMEY